MQRKPPQTGTILAELSYNFPPLCLFSCISYTYIPQSSPKESLCLSCLSIGVYIPIYRGIYKEHLPKLLHMPNELVLVTSTPSALSPPWTPMWHLGTPKFPITASPCMGSASSPHLSSTGPQKLGGRVRNGGDPRFGCKDGTQARAKQDQSHKHPSDTKRFLKSKAKRPLVIWGCRGGLYGVNTAVNLL